MNIYDLDNEYGGYILADSDTGNPALQVNNNSAGYPAIAVYSTASYYPVDVVGLDFGARFRSGATGKRALEVGAGVNGSASIAPLRILGSSIASGALIGFGGGFISCTSILLTSAANTDYVIPVEINGEARYIPVFKSAAIVGGAAY